MSKSVMITNARKNVPYVYTDEQLAYLRDAAGLADGVVTSKTIDATDFSDTEYLFSTWGMFPPTESQLDRMPNLKAVFYGAGATDHFARPFLKRGIKVISAWKANAVPVAEFTVAQILLAMKNYFRLSREMTSPEAWKTHENGKGNYGETVALLGAGAIANKVAELLKPFHLNVQIIPSRPERRTVGFEEVFRTAYVVSNHLPNREDNVKCITREHFASMRKNATFINTGRGAQVDEAGLTDVLERRPDLTAVLDVTFPEPPEPGSKLYTLPNVLLSPHIAGSLGDEVHRMAEFVISDYKRMTAGEPLLYEVTEEMLMTH